MTERNYTKDKNGTTFIGRPRFSNEVTSDYSPSPQGGPVEKPTPPLATKKSIHATLQSIYGNLGSKLENYLDENIKD